MRELLYIGYEKDLSIAEKMRGQVETVVSDEREEFLQTPLMKQGIKMYDERKEFLQPPLDESNEFGYT